MTRKPVTMQCPCTNTARYVDTDGHWWCALCCMAAPAMRAIDAPRVVELVDALLTQLDQQQTSAGSAERQELRGLLGRYRS